MNERTFRIPLYIVHCTFYIPVSIQLLTADNDLSCYEAWVRAHPQGSLWQSLVRKRYAEACGKEVRVYVTSDKRPVRTDIRPGGQATSDQPDSGLAGKLQASALVVIDRTTGGFSTWEIARGPLWASFKLQALSYKTVSALLERIVSDAKREGALALYLSSILPLEACSLRLEASPRHIHAQATRFIDLSQPEEAILAQMHPKGRYNISIAQRHGVTVSEGSIQDIDAFYDLLRDTGSRDGFKIHQKSHYTRFLDCIEGSFLLMAEHAQKPIAGLIGVRWQTTGIYYYGASSYADRQLMAPYLLQWEAMRKCKAMGCTKYDLLGVEQSEGKRARRQEGKKAKGFSLFHLLPFFPFALLPSWSGISEFKRKFGGTVITYPPERMIVLRPLAYKALELKRSLFG